MKDNSTTLTMSDSCRKLVISSDYERVVNVLMPSVVSATGIYSITLSGCHNTLVNVISADNEGIIISLSLNRHERAIFMTSNGIEWFLISATRTCY